MAASGTRLKVALLRIGCASLLLCVILDSGEARDPGPPNVPSILRLSCQVSGGGYAIKDLDDRTLENGDGAPFAPQPGAILEITHKPPGVRIIVGSLPHPDCASGPVLGSIAPIRFTWCKADYEIAPDTAGRYTLQSTSRAPLAVGPHQGDIMEAFMVGTCAASR